MKTKILVLSFIAFIFLQACAGGGGDDNGTCTILKSGDNIILKNISLEACQDKFINEPGARGWKWEPNN